MKDALEKAKEALESCKDSITKNLQKWAYKDEQALYDSLMKVNEALAALEVEKPMSKSEFRRTEIQREADKPVDGAASCAGLVVAMFANGGTLGYVLNNVTSEIQQYAECYHQKKLAEEKMEYCEWEKYDNVPYPYYSECGFANKNIPVKGVCSCGKPIRIKEPL